MAIGRFEFDEDEGEYKVNYYYTDDAGNEQPLPGNAVIIAREGDASTIGQGADVKEQKALLRYLQVLLLTQLQAQAFDRPMLLREAILPFQKLFDVAPSLLEEAKLQDAF